jgi:hypothetical protein
MLSSTACGPCRSTPNIWGVGDAGTTHHLGSGTQLLTAGPAKLSTAERSPAGSVAAVVTNCTAKKTRKAGANATPVSLAIGAQVDVETEWLLRLSSLEPEVAAGALYAGRGFGIVQTAAGLAKAPLFIASAGLGLVAEAALAPAYGLTLAGKTADAVSARVRGGFRPDIWFEAMLSGRFSSRWAHAFGDGEGEVLIGLTQPYARMVGRSLAALPPSHRSRLRLFGLSLEAALPEVLHSAIAPYDRRLDVSMPGLLSHFSSRALLHFVQAGLPSLNDRTAEFEAVKAALGEVSLPDRPRRPSRTDADIVAWLAERLRSERGIARLLGVLRHDEGIACEQARFTRLYRAALEQRAAA